MKLPAGKQQWDTRDGPQVSPEAVGPATTAEVLIATIRPSAAVIKGELGTVAVDMMLDSGSSVSLVRNDIVDKSQGVRQITPREFHLVSAAGERTPVVGHVSVPVQVCALGVEHPFVVMDSLIAPVILGMNFLEGHGIILDFASSPVQVLPRPQGDASGFDELKPVVAAVDQAKAQYCVAITLREMTEEVVDDCAIPQFGRSQGLSYDCTTPVLLPLIEEYKDLFQTTPGTTTVSQHFIPTTGTPVRVPPQRVPVNYREEVEQQLQLMLQAGVIERSSSPWMAPAVFVRKKSGEIRLCVDYHELNKKTAKDAYPLPRPDEVQDRLAGSSIFSTLDLHSGYWQVPIQPEDRPKTAFSLGPGMGLYQTIVCHLVLLGLPARSSGSWILC